jgi:hypothetical protein
MTTGTADAGSWKRPRLRALELASESLRIAAAGAPRLWPVWLVWVAADAAAFAGMRQLVGDQSALPFPLAAATTLGLSAMFAIPAALSLRGFLREPMWRLDRGLLVYALIEIGFSAAESLPVSGLLSWLKATGAGLETLRWAGFLAGTAAWMISLYPATRLLPWAAGQALGDRQMTARFAWSAMRGAVWPAILADVGLSAVPYLAHTSAWGVYYYGRGPWALAATASSLLAWNVVLVGLQAVVYRRRITEAERYSDVFA